MLRTGYALVPLRVSLYTVVEPSSRVTTSSSPYSTADVAPRVTVHRGEFQPFVHNCTQPLDSTGYVVVMTRCLPRYQVKIRPHRPHRGDTARGVKRLWWWFRSCGGLRGPQGGSPCLFLPDGSRKPHKSSVTGRFRRPLRPRSLVHRRVLCVNGCFH